MKRLAGTALQRFASERAPLAPEKVRALPPDHPAIVEGRPLFPTTVVSAKDAPRLFVSGVNSKKLGKVVTKGPLKGFHIYSLTLPERTTCPRTCYLWAKCYGSAMHWSRRHAPGLDLEQRIEREVEELAHRHPRGVLIRLHVLGDFYSVEYVDLWSRLLTRFPMVHVFGYTAHRTDTDNENDAAIAWAIADLKLKFGRQFSIRWSRQLPVRGGATTIGYVPEGPRVPEGLVCPAEVEKTQACATCGLCWHPSFKDETIVFVLHGYGVNQIGRQGREQAENEEKQEIRVGRRRSKRRTLIPGVGYAPIYRRDDATGALRKVQP